MRFLQQLEQHQRAPPHFPTTRRWMEVYGINHAKQPGTTGISTTLCSNPYRGHFFSLFSDFLSLSLFLLAFCVDKKELSTISNSWTSHRSNGSHSSRKNEPIQLTRRTALASSADKCLVRLLLILYEANSFRMTEKKRRKKERKKVNGLGDCSSSTKPLSPTAARQIVHITTGKGQKNQERKQIANKKRKKKTIYSLTTGRVFLSVGGQRFLLVLSCNRCSLLHHATRKLSRFCSDSFRISC